MDSRHESEETNRTNTSSQDISTASTQTASTSQYTSGQSYSIPTRPASNQQIYGVNYYNAGSAQMSGNIIPNAYYGMQPPTGYYRPPSPNIQDPSIIPPQPSEMGRGHIQQQLPLHQHPPPPLEQQQPHPPPQQHIQHQTHQNSQHPIQHHQHQISQPPYQPYQQQPNEQPVPPGMSKRVSFHRNIPSNAARKRAFTACDTCRLRKIKCDNKRPRCSSCEKNANPNCHYRIDDNIKDAAPSDTTSVNILSKLNMLLKEVQDIKKIHGIENEETNTAIKKPKKEPKKEPKKPKTFHYDNCIWDMSVTSIMKWEYFSKCIAEPAPDIGKVIEVLIKNYDNQISLHDDNMSIDAKLIQTQQWEAILSNCFAKFVTSFLINCHTKAPVLDMLELLESVEIYKYLKAYNPQLTFVNLVEMYQNIRDKNSKLPSLFYEALHASNIPDTEFRRRAFRSLCKSVPIIIMVCALGALATPVQLGNLSKFKTSLEERNSLEIGALSDPHSLDNIPGKKPTSRIEVAYGFVNYATLISSLFPFTTCQTSPRTVVFHLLVSQFHLNCMTSLSAYKSITTACQAMVYYLEIKKNRISEEPIHKIKPRKKEYVDRLFWTCLKLECELRVELSPYVPISGITQVIPPTSFPKVVDPLSSHGRDKYSEASYKLASKHYDEHSWYYFLTEIAVRKVDNKMFDELYSYESSLKGAWDQEPVYSQTIWVSFIKYLNQYNGIINSLSSDIRKFVLQEIEVDQIYVRMKENRKSDEENSSSPADFDIFDKLDEFLIDDDLLLRGQSESIMYIKTRILTSKLLLFRPIIYLILQDRIPFMDLLMAAISVLKISSTNPNKADLNIDSPDSSVIFSGSAHSESNPSDIDVGMDYYNLLDAPLHYQKQFPDEDFTNDIEYNSTDTDIKDDESMRGSDEFKLKNPPLTKSKILRIFMQNLISIPKLLIPKLGAHRHPGSWYYLRNLFIGNIYQFMLYSKIQEMVHAAMTDPQIQGLVAVTPQIGGIEELLAMIDKLMPKQGMITAFEHSLILFSYWKDESKDCQIYHDYLSKCLAKLR